MIYRPVPRHPPHIRNSMASCQCHNSRFAASNSRRCKAHACVANMLLTFPRLFIYFEAGSKNEKQFGSDTINFAVKNCFRYSQLQILSAQKKRARKKKKEKRIWSFKQSTCRFCSCKTFSKCAAAKSRVRSLQVDFVSAKLSVSPAVKVKEKLLLQMCSLYR